MERRSQVLPGSGRGAVVVLAAVVYIAVDSLLTPRWGNTGVWIALLWMYVARALALLLYWPRLVAAAQKPAGEGPPAG